MPARMHGANRDPSVGVGANAAVASEVCGSRVGLELESLVPRNTHIRQRIGVYQPKQALCQSPPLVVRDMLPGCC